MTVYPMNLSTTESTNHIGQVNVRQDDEGSQVFKAKITSNNLKYELEKYDVFLNVRFNNMIIARDIADSVDYISNEITYTLKSPFYQQLGRQEAFFTFEYEGVRDSTANFCYTVIPGNCRNIRQGNYIYELEQLYLISEDIIKNKDFTVLINEIHKINGRVDRLFSGLSNVYTKEETYSKSETYSQSETDKKITDALPGIVTQTTNGLMTSSDKKSFDTLMSLSEGVSLWKGLWFFTNTQTITPDVPIARCKNGWMLIWQPYNNGVADEWGYQYTPVYKISKYSRGISLILSGTKEEFMTKYAFLSADGKSITGEEKNGVAPRSGYVLTEIKSF